MKKSVLDNEVSGLWPLKTTAGAAYAAPAAVLPHSLGQTFSAVFAALARSSKMLKFEQMLKCKHFGRPG